MKKLLSALLAGTILAAGSGAAVAQETVSDKPLFDFLDKERWIFRLRVIDVDPDEDSSVTGIAGDITADSGFSAEVDFTYFFTDHIAAELIAGTTKHDMGTNLGVDLGDVWVLPPTLTLQYHFNPEGTFRPYAGVGVNYMFFYNEDPGAVASVDYDDGWGYAFQVGADYALNENWALNADIKKIYNNVDVSVNGGAIRADVDLDPWVFGMGVAYRF